MNAICPKCQVAAPLQFAMGVGVIDVRCAACGAVTPIRPTGTASAKAVAPQPGAVQVRCPKCESPFSAGMACATCGLAAALFDSFAAQQTTSETIEAAWEELLPRWSDASAHKAFLDKCSFEREYMLGAKRYRGVLRERPKDPAALQALDRLARMVEVTMTAETATRSVADEPAAPFKGVVAILILCIFLAVVGVLYALVRGENAETPSSTTPQPPAAR